MFKPCGIMPALVTPLTDREEIDEAALRRLVNHVIAGGVQGVFAAGTQGEAYALSIAERTRVIEIVVQETAGRVPVYAGTGAITTADTVTLTRNAELAGADALSVITPFFITPAADELYAHYATVAAATKLPVLLYTNPARTGVALSADLAVRLAAIENIVGIKDSSGDLTLTLEYIRRGGPDFHVLSGRDTLIFATLASGGAGAIAATANVAPRLVAEIYDAYQAGELARARAAQQQLAPLRLAFEMGTFPVVIKEALAMMGICGARAKAPVGPMAETRRAQLKQVLEQLGVLA